MLTEVQCRSCKQAYNGPGPADGRCPICKADLRPSADNAAAAQLTPATKLSAAPAGPARPWPAPSHGTPSPGRLAEILLASTLRATAAMLTGGLACFVLVRFLIPRWDGFLDSHLVMTEQDADRIAESRYALVILAFLCLPWLLVYGLTLITAAVAARRASSAVRRGVTRSAVLRVGSSLLIGSISATVTWAVTGLLYRGADSVAVTVHRYLLAGIVPLLATVLARYPLKAGRR